MANIKEAFEEVTIYVVHSDADENNILQEFDNLSEALEYAKDNIDELTYIEEVVMNPESEEIYSTEIIWSYDEDSAEDQVVCEWCGELDYETNCRKELNLGLLCKNCQAALYSRGEKPVYYEAYDSDYAEGDDIFEQEFPEANTESKYNLEESTEPKWNIGSNKLVDRDSVEYHYLEELAARLQEERPYNEDGDYIFYEVARTYEDYGAGMEWYTIIVNDPKSIAGSYQLLYPNQWIRLANTGDVEGVLEDILKGSQLTELFDISVNASVDGGENNDVSVLSSYEPKKGEDKLDELFDADINLSLDGGTGNNVSVLSPLGGLGEALQEGLNNSEFAEYLQLCKEIGIKGNKDLESFMNEVGLEAGCDPHNVLDALREYRAELGPDFKIIHENVDGSDNVLNESDWGDTIDRYRSYRGYEWLPEWHDDAKNATLSDVEFWDNFLCRVGYGRGVRRRYYAFKEGWRGDFNVKRCKEFISTNNCKSLEDVENALEWVFKYFGEVNVPVQMYDILVDFLPVLIWEQASGIKYTQDGDELIPAAEVEERTPNQLAAVKAIKALQQKGFNDEKLFSLVRNYFESELSESAHKSIMDNYKTNYEAIEECLNEGYKIDLPQIRVRDIQRELDLHGEIIFNLVEPIDESDESGWRGASEMRIVEADGEGYEGYYQWLDQDGDSIESDGYADERFADFEELLYWLDDYLVNIVDLDEYIGSEIIEGLKEARDPEEETELRTQDPNKEPEDQPTEQVIEVDSKVLEESQSQEISNEYSRLSKKYGIDFEDLVYGEGGFMQTKYPGGFPDFDGDVIYSEKYFNELKAFMSVWKKANELITKSEARGEKLKRVPIDWLEDEKIRREIENPAIKAKARFASPENNIYVFPEEVFNGLFNNKINESIERPEAPKDLSVVKEPGDPSISEGDLVWFNTRKGEDVVIKIIKFTKNPEGKRDGCRAVYTEPRVTRKHKEHWWKEDNK